MVGLKIIEALFTLFAGAFIGSYIITIVSRIKNKEKSEEGTPIV